MILVNGDSRKYIYTNIQVFVLLYHVKLLTNCVLYTHRMREQVKGRMEVLLEQEIQSRQLSATTTNSAKPVSRTSQTGLSGSTTSRTGGSVGSATRGVSEVGEEGGRESTKADLVFNVDSGTYCVCVC